MNNKKERGMTAGFLASKGAKFAEKLPEQRLLTHERVKAVTKFLAHFQAERVSVDFSQKIDQTMEQVSKMSSIRDAVNAQSIAKGDAISYYTGLNARMLSIIEAMAKISQDTEITVQIVA